jgi:hypothetical protein
MPDSSYCRVAFDEARQQRSQSPFSEGASKLRKTEDTLKRMGETIQNISRLKPPQPNASVGCCMYDERDDWLRGLPEQIAELLGCNILPAIAALGGDGVSRDEVDNRLDVANLRAKRLLKACEALRVRPTKDLAIRGYRLAVFRILDDAYRLVRIGLDAVEP